MTSKPFTKALENKNSAWGLKHLKTDFCFLHEDNIAYALGFPHFKFLLDDTSDPFLEAEKILTFGYPFLDSTYGKNSAQRLVRALARTFPFQSNESDVITPEARAALKIDEEILEDEAKEIIRSTIKGNDCPPPYASAILFIIEALYGPGFVSENVIKVLNNLPYTKWISYGHVLREIVDTIFMMSIRLPEQKHNELYKSLNDLYNYILDESKKNISRDALMKELNIPIENIVPIVNGKADLEKWKEEQIRRRNLKLSLDFLDTQAGSCGFDHIYKKDIVSPPRPVIEASPDTVFLARSLDKKKSWYSLPDPRLIFLGGDEVYRIELNHWKKRPGPTPEKEGHRIILDRFGRIKSPCTVELILDMISRSKVKKEATNWLNEHIAYSKPFLKDLASSISPLSENAKEFLQVI